MTDELETQEDNTNHRRFAALLIACSATISYFLLLGAYSLVVYALWRLFSN